MEILRVHFRRNLGTPVSESATPTREGISRIRRAPLNHEVLDDTRKERPVVFPLLGAGDEGTHVAGDIIVEAGFHGPDVGLYRNESCILLGSCMTRHE